ncbi:hypothetical protein [Klenkia soli]|uniref:hypothetical protein n=1 Tax=Klenkia soli TaxID=1052260 RepID=UPI000B8652B8|nr:hypothetical protein [Klenkia soli]
MQEIFVDYSSVGRARRFSTRVKATIRRELHPGDTVMVSGDGVVPARALMLTVSAANPEVELELLDS